MHARAEVSGITNSPDGPSCRKTLTRRGFFGGALGVGLGIATSGGASAVPGGRAVLDGLGVGANLLSNPGFEDVVENMPAQWDLFSPDSAAHIRSSQGVVRSGEWSVELDDPSTSAALGLRSSPVEVIPGQTYEGSVFVYSDSGEPSVYLEFWEGDTRVWNEFRIHSFAGSWQRVDLRGTAPEGATHATLLVYSSASNVGTSYFDDAAIGEVTPLEAVGFGPAALTAAVRGAVVLDDGVFISSRFNTPDGKLRIGEFDIATGAERNIVDLDIDSSGGHALATDGRYIYIGPAGHSRIWRYDPQTHEARAWAQVGASTTWYYSMTIADGYLYIGTYPDCMVRRVNLADASVETYGRVSDSLYATAVVVDDDYVYGGSASPGGLLRWPKDGGDPLDLSSHLSDSPVGILGMAISDGHLYVASGGQLISIRPDGSDRVVREIPQEDRYIDQMGVAPDGTVYALARLTTNHYRVTPTGLEKVGQPADHMENQMLQPTPEGRLIGVSGLGHIWNLEPDGVADVWDTATRGFGYPEVAQSLLLSSEELVWVGGHYAMTVHHPGAGDSWRFDINGEPKALAEGSDGTIYAGLYPSGQVVGIDPQTHEISVLGTLGNQQMRIRDMYSDMERGQLLVASGPSGGQHTGALTFVDLSTGEFDVRRDYLPDQAVMGIAVDGSIAYIVGDTYGESTPGPIRSAAQVAAVDLESREILWREELRADWLSYEDAFVADGVLYLMARRPSGIWFAHDLETGQTILEGDLGGYGAFGGADGRVFTWVHWAEDIRELPSEQSEDGQLLHSGIAMGWYNNPVFNLTPDRTATWGMHGTDLALFPLVAEEGEDSSLVEQTQALQSDTAAYIDDGQIAGPLAHQLTNALDQAERHLEADRTQPSVAALGRFVRHLENPKVPDTLSDQAQEYLLAGAGSILDQLT